MKKYQLPKEFAEKWVEALRSGEYKQTEGHMIAYRNHNPCYCSIGVSAIICGFRNKEIESKYSVTKTMHTSNPSYPVELVGSYRTNKLLHEITKLNDIKKLSLPQIANWLTDNIEFV